MNRRNVAVPLALGLSLLLLLVLSTLLRPGAEDRPGEDTSPLGMAGPGGDYILQFGPPDEWFVAGAKGKTYPETLAGEGLRTGSEDVYLGQSPPDGPYLPSYVIGRAYVGWDTSTLPDGAEILSATLVLELPAGGGRETPLEVTVCHGTWTPPIGLDDWQPASLRPWRVPARGSPGGEAVGRWHLPASRAEEREQLHTGQGLTLHAPEPARTMRVALDPAVVDLTGVTRLELRHAGEGTPPTTTDLVLLGRTMITLEVKVRP